MASELAHLLQTAKTKSNIFLDRVWPPPGRESKANCKHLCLAYLKQGRVLGVAVTSGTMTADLLASQPLLPALGLASAVVLLLSIVVLLIRHRSSQPKGARKSSVFVNGEQAASEEDERPKVLILFGTQTGTAERFSKQLKAELAARYGDGNRYEVLDMEEFKAEGLDKEKVVFFMMATYGDGEPTDNAADFYGWLVKSSSDADKGIGNAQLLQVPYFL